MPSSSGSPAGARVDCADASGAPSRVVSLEAAFSSGASPDVGPSVPFEANVADVEADQEYTVAAAHASSRLVPMLPEGALDSACNRASAGLRWITAYILLLVALGLDSWVVRSEPKVPETFKFGNGGRLPTLFRYLVPIVVSGARYCYGSRL